MTAAEPDQTSPPYVVDMTDEQLVQDPFTGYSRIRERAPLVRGFMPRVDPAWIVTRYHDVKLVLGDPRFVIDSANVPGMNLPSLHEQVTSSRIPPEYSKYVSSRMGELDGADHARLRNVAGASFSARRADEYRSRIKEICVELLDRLPDKAEDGVADLQAHFALPFAFNVLCELIGLPKDDFRRWRDWLEQIRRPDTWRDMVAYTRKLVEVRRQGESAADDDLISALIRARYGTGPDGGRISDTEMIAMIMHMGSSAYVTPAFMIGNGTVFLLTHPDQLALLRANPELTPQAVHELLRCCAPITLSPHLRYATEDVEIGGMVVKKGEAVWAAFRAANYDPRRFADPERFDITRQQEGRFEDHLSFSHGMHRCLGSHVARVELEVAFEALPHRFPNLTLAVAPENLRNERLPFQWGYAAVPVRL